MPGNERFTVRVVLERLEVPDEYDPCWLEPGIIRFACRVMPGSDEGRAQVTSIPREGVLELPPGEPQPVELVIFDGSVEPDEDLTIQIACAEDAFLDPESPWIRYARHFSGDPLSWSGFHDPGDEVADPEARADLRLWYWVEVQGIEEYDTVEETWTRRLLRDIFIDERRDAEGHFDPYWRQKALDQRERMRAMQPVDDDPGGPAPDNDTRALCHLPDGEEVLVVLAENPDTDAGFGDINRVVEVLDEQPLDDEAALKIGVAVEELDGIDPATLRLFKWDALRDTFRIVERSGLGADGTYVWGKIHSAGVYGVFGLPSDQASLSTVRIWCELESWVAVLEAAGVDRFAHLMPRVCELLLCAPELQPLLAESEALAQFGLEDQIGVDLAQYGDPPFDKKGRPTGPRPRVRPGPRPVSGDAACARCERTVMHARAEHRSVTCQLLGKPGGPRGEWKSIGPTNWGGRVKAIAWHPTNSKVVYAGNSQGGVFKSTDGGIHWRALMSQQRNLEIGALAVAPGAEGMDIIYAGTGEYGWWYGRGVGIYKSLNGGCGWELTAGRPSSGCFSKIIVHPTNPRVVYAAGSAGVERTTDGGKTWTRILSGSVSDIVMDPTNSKTIYAGCEDDRGVRKISNAEKMAISDGDWQPMNAGLTLMKNHSRFPRDNFIKLATTTDSSGKAVFWLQINYLVDPWTNPRRDPKWGTGDYRIHVYRWNGNSWDRKGTLAAETYYTWCSTIAVEPGNPDVVYAGGTAFYWTPDAGAHWYRVDSGHADNHAVALDPSDKRRTLVGNDGGLFHHTRKVKADGTPAETTWRYTSVNDGHVTIQFENVAVSQRGTFLVAGSTQDQGVLANRTGTSFDAIGGTEWGPLDVFARDGNIVMWDPKDKHLQRSEDGGRTSRDANNGLAGRQLEHHRCPIVMHPTDSRIVLVAPAAQEVNGLDRPAAIFRSTDGGAPSPATGFTSVQQFVNGRVADIAFAPSDPTRVYAVVTNGQVWFSTDTGATWTQLGNGPVSDGTRKQIASITVDWADPNRIYVTYRGSGISHVWRGQVRKTLTPPITWSVTWRDISRQSRNRSWQLPDVPAHRLIVDRHSSDTLYVATDVGVFETPEGGAWWRPFDQGLPNAVVLDIAYRTSADTLYVATFGRGMYARRLYRAE